MALCEKCGDTVDAEELVLFWSFNICWSCNKALARVLRLAVDEFMGIPKKKNPDQMVIPL